MLDGLIIEPVHRGQFSFATEGDDTPPLSLQVYERPPKAADLNLRQGATGPVKDSFWTQPSLLLLVEGAEAPKAP